MPRLKHFDYTELGRVALESYLRDKPEVIAIDTETTGVAYYDYPFCISIAWEGESHYLEIDKANGYASAIILSTPRWVFHNAKFDLQKLLLSRTIYPLDIYHERIEDTEALAHLLDENRKKGLKPLAKELLGESTKEEKVLRKVRRKMKLKKEDGYDLLPRHVISRYAKADAEFTFRLYKVLSSQISAYPDLCDLYRREIELSVVLLEIEANGLGIDNVYVDAKIKELGNGIVEAMAEIQSLVGKPVGKNRKDGEFNPESPDQLLAALKDRGNTGLDSTAKQHLSTLDDPLASTVLELRRLRKLRSTYLLAIRDESKGGILHPWFRQHGARTGRMASGSAINN